MNVDANTSRHWHMPARPSVSVLCNKMAHRLATTLSNVMNGVTVGGVTQDYFTVYDHDSGDKFLVTVRKVK